jgi:hypothetical protein
MKQRQNAYDEILNTIAGQDNDSISNMVSDITQDDLINFIIDSVPSNKIYKLI